MTIKVPVRFFLLILLWVFQSLLISSESITVGKSVTFFSKVLNQERNILVYLPPEYNYSKNKYHVMYLLDGEQSFYYTAGIVHFLSNTTHIPKTIVVAIPNKSRIDRNRNLTPSKSSTTLSSGGGNCF